MDTVYDPLVRTPPIGIHGAPTHPIERIAPVSKLLAEPVLDLTMRTPHTLPGKISWVAGNVDGPFRYGFLPPVRHVIWGVPVHDYHGVVVRGPPFFLPAFHCYGPLPAIEGPFVRVAVFAPTEIQVAEPLLGEVVVHTVACS